MSLEQSNGPDKKPERKKNEVVKGPLNIVKTPMQRIEQTGRRGMIKLGGATLASYLVAEAATPMTSSIVLEKVMPERPADLSPAQRAEIETELKKFEEARAKGLKDWGQKWWENAKKGFDKHGIDVFSSMKEFSEEGLRARVLKYDFLKESYDSAYKMGYGAVFYGVYSAYAIATFYVVESRLSAYFEHKSKYDAARKTQNAVNDTAAALAAEQIKTERLQAALANLEARVKELETSPLVSPEAFAALMEDHKKLDREASPLLLQDLSTRVPESPVDKKDEQA